MAINTTPADLGNYSTYEICRRANSKSWTPEEANPFGIEEPVKPNYYALKKQTPKDIGDVVEHMPFWLANAMKYLYRVDDKDIPISNLEKAIECIKREIERRDGKV